MQIKLLLTAMALLIVGSFNIATSSISTSCYNQENNVKFKEDNQSSFNFVIVNLVSAILVVLSASFMIYMSFKGVAEVAE